MRRIAFLLLFFIASSSLADTLTGRVVAVSDGDTVTVLDSNKQQHKIRLAGIDAPEKKQAFGQRAKQQLSDLVYRQEVTVEWLKTDRYQRKVGKIMVVVLGCTGSEGYDCSKAVDANLAMINAGFAWHYKQYQREQSVNDRMQYAEAEEAARDKHIGLWRDPHPEAPWEYRRRNKSGRLDTQ